MPGNNQAKIELRTELLREADRQEKLGDFGASVALLDEYAQSARRRLTADPTNVNLKSDLAFALSIKGRMEGKSLGNFDAAISTLREAVELSRQLYLVENDNPLRLKRMIDALHQTGTTHQLSGDLSTATTAFVEMREISTELNELEPGNRASITGLAYGLWWEGFMSLRRMDLETALVQLEDSKTYFHKLIAVDPPKSRDRVGLGDMLTHLATTYRELGDDEVAHKTFKSAYTEFARVHREGVQSDDLLVRMYHTSNMIAYLSQGDSEREFWRKKTFELSTEAFRSGLMPDEDIDDYDELRSEFED